MKYLILKLTCIISFFALPTHAMHWARTPESEGAICEVARILSSKGPCSATMIYELGKKFGLTVVAIAATEVGHLKALCFIKRCGSVSLDSVRTDMGENLVFVAAFSLSKNPGPTVDYLLEIGVSAHYQHPITQRTALHEACILNRVDIVEALLKHGIDHTIRDVHGKKALDYALELGHTEALQLLVQKKDHCSLKDLIPYAMHEDKKVLLWLLDRVNQHAIDLDHLVFDAEKDWLDQIQCPESCKQLLCSLFDCSKEPTACEPGMIFEIDL